MPFLREGHMQGYIIPPTCGGAYPNELLEVRFSFYPLLTMSQSEPNTIPQISINKNINRRKLQES